MVTAPHRERASAGPELTTLDFLSDAEAATSFEDLPVELLADSDWKVIGMHRWRRSEVIHLLEGRSGTYVLRHLTREPKNHHHRHLRYGDNMSLVCVFNKMRAADPQLNNICRIHLAFIIASDIRLTDRWVPSERNAADRPSRHPSLRKFARPTWDGDSGAHPGGSAGASDAADPASGPRALPRASRRLATADIRRHDAVHGAAAFVHRHRRRAAHARPWGTRLPSGREGDKAYHTCSLGVVDQKAPSGVVGQSLATGLASDTRSLDFRSVPGASITAAAGGGPTRHPTAKGLGPGCRDPVQDLGVPMRDAQPSNGSGVFPPCEGLGMMACLTFSSTRRCSTSPGM